MAKFLINITHGPEHPTRAALGFLVGKAAIDAGTRSRSFSRGCGPAVARPVLDNLVGLGTGSLRESFDALRAGCPFLRLGHVEQGTWLRAERDRRAAMPDKLVELALEADGFSPTDQRLRRA